MTTCWSTTGPLRPQFPNVTFPIMFWIPSNSSASSTATSTPVTLSTKETSSISPTSSNPASNHLSESKGNPPLILKLKGPMARRILNQLNGESKIENRRARNRKTARMSRERRQAYIKQLEAELRIANGRAIEMHKLVTEMQQADKCNQERIAQLESQISFVSRVYQ